MQDISLYDINEERNFPFVSDKLLPILDIRLQVPLNTEKVWISSVTSTDITFTLTFNGQNYEYAVAENIHTPEKPINIYRLLEGTLLSEDAIGFIQIEKTLPFELTFTSEETELEDRCLIYKSYQGIKNVYVRKNNGELIKLGKNIELVAGENIRFRLPFVDSLTLREFQNYVRRIVVDGDTYVGKSINIFGRNLIDINADVFSTRINDPNLRCPVVFDPLLKGLPGDIGEDGNGGGPGQSLSIDVDLSIPCPPCLQQGGEFDSECLPPPLPPFDDSVPNFNIPGGSGFPDIDIPELPPGLEEDEEEQGDGCPFDPIELALYDEYTDQTITFFGGIYLSNLPNDTGGPLNEVYGMLLPQGGVFADYQTSPNLITLPDDEYVIVVEGIPVSSGGGSSLDLYYPYGFREDSILTGAIGFNKNSAGSVNHFTACFDEDCRGAIVYETTPFSSNPPFTHGGGSLEPILASAFHAGSKETYVVFSEGDGTFETDQILNGLVSDARNNHSQTTLTISLYNTTQEWKISSKPLFIDDIRLEEHARLNRVNNDDIYRLSSPSGPLGIGAVSGIISTEVSFGFTTFYDSPNYVWMWAETPNNYTYMIPDNRQISWLGRPNTDGIIRVYENTRNGNQTTDYLANLSQIEFQNVVSSQVDSEGFPYLECEYCFYGMTHDQEEDDGFDDFKYGTSVVTVWGFFNEYFTDGPGQYLAVRAHHLAYVPHNVPEAARPVNAREFYNPSRTAQYDDYIVFKGANTTSGWILDPTDIAYRPVIELGSGDYHTDEDMFPVANEYEFRFYDAPLSVDPEGDVLRTSTTKIVNRFGTNWIGWKTVHSDEDASVIFDKQTEELIYGNPRMYDVVVVDKTRGLISQMIANNYSQDSHYLSAAPIQTIGYAMGPVETTAKKTFDLVFNGNSPRLHGLNRTINIEPQVYYLDGNLEWLIADTEDITGVDPSGVVTTMYILLYYTDFLLSNQATFPGAAAGQSAWTLICVTTNNSQDAYNFEFGVGPTTKNDPRGTYATKRWYGALGTNDLRVISDEGYNFCTITGTDPLTDIDSFHMGGRTFSGEEFYHGFYTGGDSYSITGRYYDSNDLGTSLGTFTLDGGSYVSGNEANGGLVQGAVLDDPGISFSGTTPADIIVDPDNVEETVGAVSRQAALSLSTPRLPVDTTYDLFGGTLFLDSSQAWATFIPGFNCDFLPLRGFAKPINGASLRYRRVGGMHDEELYTGKTPDPLFPSGVPRPMMEIDTTIIDVLGGSPLHQFSSTPVLMIPVAFARKTATNWTVRFWSDANKTALLYSVGLSRLRFQLQGTPALGSAFDNSLNYGILMMDWLGTEVLNEDELIGTGTSPLYPGELYCDVIETNASGQQEDLIAKGTASSLVGTYRLQLTHTNDLDTVYGSEKAYADQYGIRFGSVLTFDSPAYESHRYDMTTESTGP